ncbi:MAG: hypothetical protein HN368_23790 [Spirochaetales bacterium]|jgi:hypothetical protein|nr:hypothetical protein [Spirochaetales bacterium]
MKVHIPLGENRNSHIGLFSNAWPSARKDFRTPGDESWKIYAMALRDLVVSGDSAVIVKGLADENRQVRAICARALGFLRSEDSVSDLSAALCGDEWATVRLITADSLGMIYSDYAIESLRSAKKSEEENDVLLHIDIALNRDSGRENDALEKLLSLEKVMLDAARIGAPAPDFTLPTGEGDFFDLTGYRDGGAVALYFLYGDG